jgi:hypothetical protein
MLDDHWGDREYDKKERALAEEIASTAFCLGFNLGELQALGGDAIMDENCALAKAQKWLNVPYMDITTASALTMLRALINKAKKGDLNGPTST